MVVSYRDRFIKSFFIFLFLAFLLFGVIFWTYSITSRIESISTTEITLASLLTKFLPDIVIIMEGAYFYCHYLLSKAKGYSGWLTLLGFIQTFGLIILFFLPDKRKSG